LSLFSNIQEVLSIIKNSGREKLKTAFKDKGKKIVQKAPGKWGKRYTAD